MDPYIEAWNKARKIAFIAAENSGEEVSAFLTEKEMMVMMRDFQGSPLTRTRMMSFGIDVSLFF